MVYIYMYIPVESYLYGTIYRTLKYLSIITLCMPGDNFLVCQKPFANSLNQDEDIRMSVLIWIQTVWHSDGGPECFI